MVDLTSAQWFKSSYSADNGGNCVEAAFLAEGRVAVRDSKDPAVGALVAGPAEWGAFLRAVKTDAI